jgi:hypothetical protein
MSRKSVQARASAAVVIPGRPIAPPDDLDAVERQHWLAITAALPASWIAPEQVPLLRELVRCVRVNGEFAEVQRKLFELAKGWPADDERWRRIEAITRARAAESAQIVALSRALRLSKQSRHDREQAGRDTKRTSATPKPWEHWGDELGDSTKQ